MNDFMSKAAHEMSPATEVENFSLTFLDLERGEKKKKGHLTRGLS